MRIVLLLVIVLASPARAGAPVPLAQDGVQPAPVEITSGHPIVSGYVQQRAASVAACTSAPLRARIRVGWNARGRARTIVVAGGGWRFARCVRAALAGGQLAISRARGGSGVVSVVLHGGVPAPVLVAPAVVPPPPPPKPPAPRSTPTGLQACTVDADCTLHFRQHACVPGDPVAVSKAAPRAQVLEHFPVRHIECGMGGPQYDRLRMSSEGRYSARCEERRCSVVDRGPQPAFP